MQAKIKYSFSAKLWSYNVKGGWFFISLPANISKEIREHLKWQEEGWGRMKAFATIKEIEWDTAIWFDKKLDTYLLPVKKNIREKANLKLDDIIAVSIII